MDYKVDKLQIAQEQQQRAIDRFAEVEKKCDLSPVAFLKDNFNNVKIRDRKDEVEFKFTLGFIISKVCALAGIKESVDQANASDVVKMILSAFNDLSIEEVYKAFELERYGSYGDKTDHFQLFNADYVSSVLKKYKKWKQETKMQHNISPAQSLPEISESAKKEIIDNGIVRVFNEFKATGVMPEPCAHIFDELYERKIIRDAETVGEQEYYQKKYIQASREIESELKKENVSSQGHLRTIREELDKIAQNNSDKVVVRSKRLILGDYFSRLIKSDKDIKTVLE